MSSAPAASIFATIQFKQDEIRRNAKAAQDAIKEAFSKGDGASIKVPITFDDKGLQAKLNAVLSKLTVQPIIVPIRFAPTGAPGGGTMPGGGTGPAGPAPAAGPPGAPEEEAAEASNAGRRSGYSRYFSRGLSRYVAPGILIHEALRGVQMYETYRSEMDRAQITGDIVGGSMRAEKAFQEGIGSIPVVGQAASLFANMIGDKRGTDRILAEAEVGDRRAKSQAGINEVILNLRRETAGVGRSAVDTQAANIEEGRLSLEEAISKSTAGVPANQRPNDAIKAARDAYARYAGTVVSRQQYLQMNAVQSMANERLVIDTRLGGDTDQAARSELAQKQTEKERELRLKDPALAERYKDTVAPAERAEFEDKIRREREKAAGDSAARISSMEGASDEKMLKAKGEVYAAIEHMMKRVAEEHVAALNREANAERDATRATQLRNEAIAVQRASVQDLAALGEEQRREGDREIRQASGEGTVGMLNAAGQHRAARDSALEAEYQEERRRIMEAGGPQMYDKLNALNMRHDAKMALNTTTDKRSARQLDIATQDAAARGRGQQGVGEVLSFQQEIEDMTKDAAGDDNRLRAVRQYSNARRAEMLRRFRPQSGNFGLDEYHDALQSSIINGQGNQEAIKLLNAMRAREGWLPAGVGGAPAGAAGGQGQAGGGGGGINDAAKQLVDAAQIIKKAKVIGVIGGK